MTKFAQAQITLGEDKIDYENPKEYNIAGNDIEGTVTLDKNVLRLVSGLLVGQRVKVPGEKFSDAIKALWKQGFFDEVQINVDKIIGNDIYLKTVVIEKPRLSGYTFKGVSKKSEADDIRKKIHLIAGKIVTDQLRTNLKNVVSEYFHDKGFIHR